MEIKKMGLDVLTIWECEILDKNRKPRDFGNIIVKIKKLL